jgi:hypothetical protein
MGTTVHTGSEERETAAYVRTATTVGKSRSPVV